MKINKREEVYVLIETFLFFVCFSTRSLVNIVNVFIFVQSKIENCECFFIFVQSKIENRECFFIFEQCKVVNRECFYIFEQCFCIAMQKII